MTTTDKPLDLFWFLPTSGDGTYLGSEQGHRPADARYLREIAQAADRLGFRGVLLPSGWISPDSRNRRSFGWISYGRSPTSSRKSEPPSAARATPRCSDVAPVNAPRWWPKRWLSRRSRGAAVQLNGTKGALWGARAAWIAGLELTEQERALMVEDLSGLQKGLAELVAYLQLAAEQGAAVAEDAQEDVVTWQSLDGAPKRAHLPRVIFSR